MAGSTIEKINAPFLFRRESQIGNAALAEREAVTLPLDQRAALPTCDACGARGGSRRAARLTLITSRSGTAIANAGRRNQRRVWHLEVKCLAATRINLFECEGCHRSITVVTVATDPR